MICFVIIYLNILFNLPEPEAFKTYPRFNTKIKITADKFVKANFKKIRPNKYEYKSLLTGTKFEIIINGNIAFAPSKWSFAQNNFLCVLNNFLVTSSGQ